MKSNPIPMQRIPSAILLLLLIGCVSLQAQRTARFTESYAPQKRGQELFDLGLFLEARHLFEDELLRIKAIPEQEAGPARETTGLMASRSAVLSGDPAGERNMLDFARSTAPDPTGNRALLEAADHYFRARDFTKASQFYDMVSLNGLGTEDRTQTIFRKGYSAFVQKQFGKARTAFQQIRDGKHAWYEPANYYHGMTLFFDGKYDEALISFRRVERSTKYSSYIPFIISQILFAQGKYDELVTYAEDPGKQNVENRLEIDQLLGRAHFEKDRFDKALPYLKRFAESGGNMMPADRYHLGYCLHDAKNWSVAITYLEPVATEQGPMGQSALYLLGSAYLRTSRKTEARNAFLQASRQTYSPAIAESAQFQFGKISAELRADREAIQSLSSVPERSPHYSEAQQLLGEVLMKTRDTEYALDYLTKAKLQTPQLKEAYQKAHYRKATQLVQAGDLPDALAKLRSSLSQSIDGRTTALATYLTADILHRQGKYADSQTETEKFLTMARSRKDLPREASIAMGHYLKGYNFLKLEKYPQASSSFAEAVSVFRTDSGKDRDRLLGDALLRNGDCHFKVNRYPDALSAYDEAITGRFSGFQYARFQKALILGLQGKPYEKIIELEDLVADFPDSDQADDALLEIGNTAFELEQNQEAVKALQRLLEHFGNQSILANAARIKLGIISYNLGDLQGAVRYYREVLENNPEPDERMAALAALEEIYVRDLSSPDEYVALLEKNGYNLSESSRDSLTFRAADNQYKAGSYEKAIQGYSQYIQRYPKGLNIVLAHFRRAECLLQTRQHAKAMEDLRSVIAMGRSRYYEDALRLAATTAFEPLKAYAESMEFYELLSKEGGTSTLRDEAAYQALRAADKAGLEDKVLEWAERVNNQQPGDTSRKTSARSMRARILLQRGETEQGQKELLELYPQLAGETKAQAHYAIAKSYQSMSQWSEAKDWCIRAPKDIADQDYWVAQCIVLLSDVFLAEGDLMNARAVLEGLLEFYQDDEATRKAATDRLAHLSDLENAAEKSKDAPTNNLLDMQEELERN